MSRKGWQRCQKIEGERACCLCVYIYTAKTCFGAQLPLPARRVHQLHQQPKARNFKSSAANCKWKGCWNNLVHITHHTRMWHPPPPTFQIHVIFSGIRHNSCCNVVTFIFLQHCPLKVNNDAWWGEERCESWQTPGRHSFGNKRKKIASTGLDILTRLRVHFQRKKREGTMGNHRRHQWSQWGGEADMFVWNQNIFMMILSTCWMTVKKSCEAFYCSPQMEHSGPIRIPLTVRWHTVPLHIHSGLMCYWSTSQRFSKRERENERPQWSNKFVDHNHPCKFGAFGVLKASVGHSFFLDYGETRNKKTNLLHFYCCVLDQHTFKI